MSEVTSAFTAMISPPTSGVEEGTDTGSVRSRRIRRGEDPGGRTGQRVAAMCEEGDAGAGEEGFGQDVSVRSRAKVVQRLR